MRPQPTLPTSFRKLHRNRHTQVVAGVAGGLAEHLRVRTAIIRLVFVLLLLANGLGALLYIAFWAVLPIRPGADGRRPAAPRGRGLARVALSLLTAGVFVLINQLQLYDVDATLVALVAVVALGAGIVWQYADPAGAKSRAPEPQREPSALPTTFPSADPDPVAPVRSRAEVDAAPDRRWFLVRVLVGSLLMIVGIVGVLGFLGFVVPGGGGLSTTLLSLIFALIAMAGLVLALAPVLWRMAGQLRDERVARIREQERAEVAAVVHDQVLHTLALIQRHAGDPGAVTRLARGQERSLRGWLYRPTGSPTERFAAALEQVAAEVENAYGISIETVVVGDADHDERVAALVAATREALVNAARHAQVTSISLYAEVEAEALTVFVRDRGVGFDPSAVSEDRHGMRGSIVGRMSRYGGTAQVRSAPGEGTEVELRIRRGSGAAVTPAREGASARE